ncbi:hypothetical protein B0H14DRAFT_2629313 [Mycena olivaceomarginata]|nr:hypothetical protein B0H14DRAFT_2629313 [Mycena olivaceomarginata]
MPSVLGIDEGAGTTSGPPADLDEADNSTPMFSRNTGATGEEAESKQMMAVQAASPLSGDQASQNPDAQRTAVQSSERGGASRSQESSRRGERRSQRHRANI